jgi:transposase
MIVATHRNQIRSLLARKNDLTLIDLRQALGLKRSFHAIHVVLGKTGLSYKKRHSAPASKTAPTSPGRGGFGASSRRVSTRPS